MFFSRSVSERGFSWFLDHFGLDLGAHWGSVFYYFPHRFRERFLHAFLCEKRGQAPPQGGGASGGGEVAAVLVKVTFSCFEALGPRRGALFTIGGHVPLLREITLVIFLISIERLTMLISLN